MISLKIYFLHNQKKEENNTNMLQKDIKKEENNTNLQTDFKDLFSTQPKKEENNTNMQQKDIKKEEINTNKTFLGFDFNVNTTNNQPQKTEETNKWDKLFF